eukprot:1415014-Prymnesium_polylepis.1
MMLRVRFPKATAAEIMHLMGYADAHKQSIADRANGRKMGSLLTMTGTLFNLFDLDGSGSIDVEEFTSCMMSCGLREQGIDKATLAIAFEAHAVEEKGDDGEVDNVLGMEQFGNVLRSLHLLKDVPKMCTRFEALQMGTYFQVNGLRATEEMADADLSMSNQLKMRPNLSERRNSVIHNIIGDPQFHGWIGNTSS